jgi:predicted kinase
LNRLPVPVLVVMAGTTGSGKTTLASALCRTLGHTRHLEADAFRKALGGVPAHERVGTSDLTAGIYSPTMTEATYEAMRDRAAALLRQGWSVVVDGSFRRRQWRMTTLEIARSANSPSIVVECSAEHVDQLRRLRERHAGREAISDGRPELLVFHEREWQPTAPWEADLVVRIDTSAWTAHEASNEVASKIRALRIRNPREGAVRSPGVTGRT